MNDKASLLGYDKNGRIVYEEIISIDEYYDGEHPWDDSDQILELGLTRVCGKLYNTDGSIFQEFETAFSIDSGEYIGSKVVHEDGTTNTEGIYQKDL